MIPQKAGTKNLKIVYDGKKIEQCCSNTPIYEIEYSLGQKWLVCNVCLEIDCFSSDIKEKVRCKQ